jgi:parallel beta-helix repeat protein
MNANPAVSKIMSSVRYFVLFLLVLFLFIGSGIILGWVLLSRAGDEPSLVPSQVNLPSTEEDEEVELGNTAQKLTVNAQLQVNGRFYLAPSSLPEDAQPGTLVFDQSTSTLKYFNGSSFVSVTQQADVPEAGVTSLQGQTGAISLSPGAGISINGTVISSSGILGINGVAGDISVTTANGIASLSLPQSIATSASPTFSALTLNGNLTLTSSASIRANLIQQTTSGQDVTINAGSDDIFFTSGGRIFQFPGVAGSPQTICTTTSGCPGGGGGSFIELAPAAAQTDASANPTIFVNDTAGGNLIQLQAGGINRFVVANDGATTVGGSLTLGSALTVANGGTGVTSLTLNSVLVGNGTGAIQQVSTGTPNQCLVSTAGAPIFAACPGSGGVASIDGQTGTVTINNATGSGGVITLDDATTGAKGIASFSATNFSVASGVVNTIQGIATTSTPTFAGLTLSSPLAVTSGGTGAANASGARSNLGAAASGANSDISSTTALNTITPSAALSIGSTTQAFTIQGASTSVITAQNGSSVTTVGFVTPIASATINFPALAAGTYTICTTSGNCLGGAGGANTSLSNLSSIAINTSLLPGTTTIDLGSNANPFRDLFIGGSATNNLRVTGTATAARTITIPDATGTVCLSTGNCAGSGGGVTTAGGNTGRLSVFTGSQVLGDSWLLQNGSTLELDSGRNLSLLGGNLTVAGNAVITAGNTLQIVGGNTASRPASPIEGMVYYDTQTDQLLTYTGGKWQADRTDAVLVAAANSSQADKDIADYVADGNTGAANDGDQIQINTALTAASGRKVVLLAGTYVVDASISLPSSTTLQGMGSATIITLPNSFNANITMMVNSDTVGGNSAISVRDLIVDGNRSNQSSGTMYGIYLDNVGTATTKGALLDSVTVKSMRYYGVFTDNASDIEIHSSSFSDFAFNDAILLGDPSTRIKINDNTVVGSIKSVSAVNNTNVQINGNTVTGSIEIQASDATIVNNVIGASSSTGIYVEGVGITVDGNSVTGSATHGIVTDGDQTIISNNTVSDNTQAGIVFYEAYRSTLSGNVVFNNGQHGIWAESVSSVITGNNVSNNGSSGAFHGIFVDYGSNHSIVGNYITDTAGTGHAIAIDTGISNTYLADNVYSGTGASTIQDLGTNTRYASQITPAQILQSGSSTFRANTASILTGSIDPIASTAVTGVGTLFTTELQVGDRITVSNETRTVTAISSDTSLTVDTAFSNNTNDTSVDRLPAGLIVKNSSGVNALSVNDMGTVRINTGSASTVGIIVQGSVSQSAYLMELRDSNNSFLGAFDGAGTYCVSTSLNICGGTYSTYGATGFTSVQSSGNMSALISQTSSFLQIGNGGTGNYGGVGILGPTGASNLGNNSLTVRGSSGQTGDVVSVQDSSGNPILAVDTAVTIGQSDTNATLLVLDSKTDAGDPAGGNGSIYYNSNAGKFRCYQAGAWTDCVGSGGGGLSGNLTDNTLNAWDIQEGTNNYINISTVNGAENISLGNTTNNPSVEILSNAKSSNQEGILTVSGSLTYPTASLSEAQYGIKSFITVQPSSAGSGFYYGSMFAPSATGANVSSATIVGVRGDGRTGSSSGTGTAVGGMFNVQNTGSGTLTIGRGIQVSDFINSGGGSITNRTGIAVAELTAGTNTTNLLIGTLNNPSGQFSVYNESTRNNVFRGNLRVGDTTAPTVALDVTGAGSFTSNLDVRGNTTLRTTTNSTNAFTVQNSASANILQVSTTNAGSITLFGNNSAELSAWSSANTLPGSRSDLVTVTAKGYAYAIGGWSTSAEDEVYRAVINSDGSLGTWSTTTSLPVGISNPAATVYGDYIYIVGGYDTATRNQVLYAKINNDGSLGAWTTSIQTIPVAGEYISGFAAKGYLFVLGGSSGGVPSSVVASAKINSNGSIDRFVTTTSIPQISANNYTESMGLAYSNGYVYLTGGSLGGCNTLTNNVRYAAVNSDGTLGSWTTSGNNLPANLEEHSVVVANGYIYALGGHTGGASCTNTVSNTYYAKLNTNGSVGAWSTATNNFTTARRTHGSLVANNFVYVVGGIDATSTALNTVRYTRLGGTLQIGGSIDLVGIQGGTLNETGTSISGSMGGSITAGNIKAVGVLEVQGAASIQGFTTLNGALVRDSLGVSSTGVHAFLVKNDTQTKSVLGVSTSTTYSTLMSGSFEDSMLNPWAAKNSGTVSITYADARFGFVSMQLVTGTAANNGAQYRYGFNESTQYTFSVWMRRSASSTSTIDIGRRDNATDTNCLTGQTVDTTWRRYSCTFTTGATIDPGAHVYIKQSDTTTDTIYIDGFSLVEGASSIDYTEPASTLQVNSADKIVSLFENEVPIPTRWQATTPFDNNISYTGFVTSRGYVYQLGGQDLSFNAYDSVKYAAVNANGSIGSWTTTSTLPETRVYHSALAANGHIYVLGGQDNWLSGAELDVYYAKVNPDGSLGAWASTTSIPGGGAMTYANGYIYILSDNGTTTYYAKVNTDGTLGAWNTNTALPVSVSYPAVTVANGYVYIAGGVVTGPSTTNVVRYAKIGNDGVLGAWNTASNLANGVVCASAVVSSGYIWVVGGTTVSNCNTGTGSYLQYAKINADGSLSPWGVTDIMGGDNINGNSVLVINNTLYVAGGDYDYSNGNTNAIFYAKFGGTLQVGGSIDLVGLGGSNIGTSGSSQGYGSVGGSITAGDGVFVGSMLVQGAATFNQSVNVSFDLVVGGSARFGGSIYLPDNNGLVLGNDNDASLGYDEAGEDRVELTGTNASLFIEDRLSFGVDARTIADNGAGTNATLTLNPNSSFVRITCSDAQGCDITMDEAVPVRDGNIVYIVNVSAVNVNFADTAGVSELGGAFAAGQYDSIQLIYSNDRWIETARSNN